MYSNTTQIDAATAIAKPQRPKLKGPTSQRPFRRVQRAASTGSANEM
jgi:hypothetical protein